MMLTRNLKVPRKPGGGGYKNPVKSRVSWKRAQCRLLAFALVFALTAGNLFSAGALRARAAEDVPGSSGTEVTTTNEDGGGEEILPGGGGEEILPGGGGEEILPGDGGEETLPEGGDEEILPENGSDTTPAETDGADEIVAEEEEETVTAPSLNAEATYTVTVPEANAEGFVGTFVYNDYKELINVGDAEGNWHPEWSKFSLTPQASCDDENVDLSALTFNIRQAGVSGVEYDWPVSYVQSGSTLAFIFQEDYAPAAETTCKFILELKDGDTVLADQELSVKVRPEVTYPVNLVIYDDDWTLLTDADYSGVPEPISEFETDPRNLQPETLWKVGGEDLYNFDGFYAKAEDAPGGTGKVFSEKVSLLTEKREYTLYGRFVLRTDVHRIRYRFIDTDGKEYREAADKLAEIGWLHEMFSEEYGAFLHDDLGPYYWEQVKVEDPGIECPEGMKFLGWFASYDENTKMFSDPYSFNSIMGGIVIPPGTKTDVDAIAKFAPSWKINYKVYMEDGTDVTDQYGQLKDSYTYPDLYTAEETITLPGLDEYEGYGSSGKIPDGWEFGGWYTSYNETEKTFSGRITGAAITPLPAGQTGADITFHAMIRKSVTKEEILKTIGTAHVMNVKVEHGIEDWSVNPEEHVIVLFANEGYETLADVNTKVLAPKGLTFAEEVDPKTKIESLITGSRTQLKVVKAGSGAGAAVPFRFLRIERLNPMITDWTSGETLSGTSMTLKGGKGVLYSAMADVVGGTAFEDEVLEKMGKLWATLGEENMTLTASAELSALTITGSGSGDWEVEAAPEAENARGSLTLTLTFPDGISMKAVTEVQLIEKGYDFSLKIVAPDDKYSHDIIDLVSVSLKPGKSETTQVFIKGELEEEYDTQLKLTVKSDNAKAVKAGAISWGEAEGNTPNTNRSKKTEKFFSIPLTVTGTGYAWITVTANDAAGTSFSIPLRVMEDEVKIVNRKVTLDKYRTAGVKLETAEKDSFAFRKVPVTLLTLTVTEVQAKKKGVNADKGWFTVGVGNELQVTETGFNAGMPDGVYLVTVEDNTSLKTKTVLTVTVKSRMPAVTVKQNMKLNLLAASGGAPVFLTATAKKETVIGGKILESGKTAPFSVEWNDADSAFEVSRNSAYTGDADLTKRENRTLTLALDVEGYRSGAVTKKVVLDVVNQLPVLKPDKKTVSFYPELQSAGTRAYIALLEGKKPYPQNVTKAWIDPTDPLYNYVKAGANGTGTAGFYVELKDSLPSSLPASVSGKVQFLFYAFGDENVFTVPLTVSFKTGSSVKLGLQKTTLRLNKNEFTDSDETLLLADKQRMMGLDTSKVKWEVLPDPKAKNLTEAIRSQFEFALYPNYDGMHLELRWKAFAMAAPAGSYKFRLQLSDIATGDVIKQIPFTVKVTDKALEKCISFRQSGKIDLTVPDSAIKLVWKAADLNAFIMHEYVERVTLTGEDAALFTANTTKEWDDKTGRYVYETAIRLKPEVDRHSLQKGKALDVSVGTVSLTSGSEVTLNKKLTVKPVQSTPKLTLTPKSGALVITPEDATVDGVAFEIRAALKGEDVPIESVRILSGMDQFAIRPTVDKNTGRAKIAIMSLRRLPRKTYTIKFAVRYVNQAGNVKDKVVTYKIKVK